MTKLNVDLLRRIQKHITEKPRRLIMRTFFLRKNKLRSATFENDGGTKTKFESCGTAACIAGWAVFLEEGMNAEFSNVRERASKLLGLPPDTKWLSAPWMHDDIFEYTSWPQPFQDAYIQAENQKKRAKVASKFIDHLIETKGYPEKESSVTL